MPLRIYGTASASIFVIVTVKGDEIVGLIGYDELNSLNRSARLSLLIDPDEHRKGYGPEAVRLFCTYLFRMRGLNKVWAYVSALDERTIDDLETVGFQRDGTLRQHHFFDAEYYDVYIYSILLFDFSS